MRLIRLVRATDVDPAIARPERLVGRGEQVRDPLGPGDSPVAKWIAAYQ
jgi:hypothetical protein